MSEYKSIAYEERLHVGLYDFDKEAEEVAEERGCYVVYPEENQLQIDIDTTEQLGHFIRRIDDLRKFFPLSDIEYIKKPSASGRPHYHITVTITLAGKPHVFTSGERIALQFALGSDPVRETLSTFRMFGGSETPTRFFEKKV